jgi:hypothetical protein
MVLHVQLGAVAGTSGTTTYRWVAYPGERLLNKVKFSVNGNPLDEYYNQDYSFFRNFELPTHKKAGYDRCAGQQRSWKGRLAPGDGSAPAPTPGVVGFGVTVGNVSNSTGLWVDVTDGYQTTKTSAAHATTTGTVAGHQQTDILEVTMPLLFWFNTDPRLAIPSVSIPQGQRFIEIDFCALSDLVQGQVITPGILAVAPSSPLTVGTMVSTAPAGSFTISGTQVPTCNLYINNIFVNPEIHDIFIKRIGFNLIRVHRRQVNRITSGASGQQLLNNFKWPIECIYFGFRQVTQSTTSNAVYLDGWCMFGECFNAGAQLTLLGTVATGAGAAVMHATYSKVLPVMQSVSFVAHGVNLYNNIPAILYNQYLPLMFGELCTPEDPGCYVVVFNLYPGLYQPSGHLNVSRSREFYIQFDNVVPSAGRNLGTTIASNDFMASAKAINFLLISDGSAVLRYST